MNNLFLIKKKGFTLKVLIVILLSIVGIVGLDNYLTLQESKNDVDKLLTEASIVGNAKCPQNIDSETRLDSVKYRNGSINYNFTINLSGENVDTIEFQSKMKGALLADLPKNNLYYLMKDNGIDLNYVYFDKEGKYICGVHLLL